VSGPRAASARAKAAHVADLAPEDWRGLAESLGVAPFRVKQVAAHYFAHLTADPAAMTDLPAGQREQLAAAVAPAVLTLRKEWSTDAGTTRKQLFHLADGAGVETVTMAYPDRVTVCVSSQAGCGMACPFCATGRMGLKRNLTAAEITDQVRQAAALARGGGLGEAGPRRLSNVVFMGMGEPLANYRALMTAIRAIVRPEPTGFGLSARKLTVSTCGLVPGIGRLAEEGLPVRLALSLHAPDDEARDVLVPVNRRYGVAQVLEAAHGYFMATGRRVSIEYALIRDVNDQSWRAALLAKRVCQYGSEWVHVNPIPLNPVHGSKWTASRPEQERAFVDELRSAGLAVSLRDTRGRDIDGACGQLAEEDTD
jgi:23S rRNA (adenine2503-C2)-methyltransferase